MTGEKHDDGKPRFSLLPFAALRSVVAVLEFGAKKYSVDGWRHVSDAQLRYWDAAMRHIIEHRTNGPLDSESGLPHLAHAACCILFLLDLTIGEP